MTPTVELMIVAAVVIVGGLGALRISASGFDKKYRTPRPPQ